MIELNDLEPFIGPWRMTSIFTPDVNIPPRAITTFEWLPGKRILIQRWDVEHPDVSDGNAIISIDPATSSYRQHYFDSRGITRLYDMEFANHVWTLQRRAEHPDFSQRFVGRFNEDCSSIVGSWEISHDQGSNWTPDFDLTYTKVG